MSIPSLRLHIDAVLALLESSGVYVGDAQAPDGYGWAGTPGQSTFTPHMIAYPLSGSLDGTLGAPNEDGSIVVQVTCVGETREQCTWVVDQAVAALVGADLGHRSTQLITLEDFSGVVRDDTVQPPVFMAAPRFRVWTTPS